jgi:phage terminase large subunit-like protein
VAALTTAVKSPVTEYAEAVTGGSIVTGRLVRLAAERHLRDLDRSDIYFDEDAAQFAIDFFPFLILSGGDEEEKPFVLDISQQFIIGSIYGWKTRDGLRRFRVAYIEEAKSNGKSPLAAGIGLFMLVADGKERAQVYSAAVDRDQAQILFRDAVAMVDRSPTLSERLTRSGGKGKEWNLADLSTGSFFRPISSEHTGGRGKSGPRVHCGLLDEVHEHPSPIMVNMMHANAKGKESLIVEITNSGYDRASICYQHHELGERVLTGVAEKDDWFFYICGLDPCERHRLEGAAMPDDDCDDCDDWRDESVWVKVNPLLGSAVSWKYVRSQVSDAIAMVGRRNIVQRLNFCLWTNQNTRWISDEVWNKNDAAPVLEGDCFAGLVVNSSFDIATLVLWFPRTKSVLPFFWIPRQFVEEHPDGPYLSWEGEDALTITEGGVTDHSAIREKIQELEKQHHIRTITTKRWNARDLQTSLIDEGFDVTEASDGMKDMSPGSKELEKLLADGEMKHGGHPVLRAHAFNAAVKTDAEGNMRPNPEESAGNITGVQALVMAIGQALGEPEDDAAGFMFL